MKWVSWNTCLKIGYYIMYGFMKLLSGYKRFTNKPWKGNCRSLTWSKRFHRGDHYLNTSVVNIKDLVLLLLQWISSPAIFSRWWYVWDVFIFHLFTVKVKTFLVKRFARIHILCAYFIIVSMTSGTADTMMFIHCWKKIPKFYGVKGPCNWCICLN